MAWHGIIIDNVGEFEAGGGEVGRNAGELLSTGEDLQSPDDTPRGTVLHSFGPRRPDFGLFKWDPNTRALVPIPEADDTRDKIQRLFDDPEFDSMQIGAANKQRIRSILTRRHPELAAKKKK